MDAVKFLKERKRICATHSVCKCKECPLNTKRNGMDKACEILLEENPEKYVEIVEKWSAEHPKKTRQSEFLKMFPNACILYIDDNKVIDILSCAIDKDFRTSNCNNKITCSECKKEYWLAEVE